MIGAESIDLKLNYYAMAIAILGKFSVEISFEKLQGEHPDKAHSQFTNDDLIDMRKLRAEGVTWKELGMIYDVPWTTVYGRLRPRKGKVS